MKKCDYGKVAFYVLTVVMIVAIAYMCIKGFTNLLNGI